ncbi:hypothetical protein Q4E93_10390 [Flavitalea sp. BT771]|uniref:hypothetical protein n=1 Tax=Flavitalea sp. BT771 TaxID=3063329 RepID=UPI0026E2838D|nr:hypothetical protein [Flavitalea sp. BT771]MDO6430997.1 hypothetical protein [Flavitalea sp. BT771]MDV6219904.1 hypothetical protein [Flavitalea sp. BT771]
MRTLAAILLWGIFLFNWVGYRLVSNFMQQQATRQMEEQLNNSQYDESQLISLKVPITHLSYYNCSSTFERVDGQIEINGIPYQYVKRRICNDSLELRCIPNQMALRLRLSRDEYFRTINDIQSSQRHQQQPALPCTVKSFVSDPYLLTSSFQLNAPLSFKITYHYFYSEQVIWIPRVIEERPPSRQA